MLAALRVPASMLTPADYLHNWHAHLEHHYASMALFPGALELVKAFKRRGVPMAIATSSERAGMLLKTSFHPELMSMIDVVITGDQVTNSKPAPDIFLKAAAALGVPANECLVFEDAPSGVLAGKAAGAHVVAVPDARFAAWNGPERFASADVIVKRLADYIVDF